jgi:NAD(P)-dependent dehydrogenase (short-subunit alcohol dehydrogenase family)
MSLKGRVAIVTGSTGALGRVVVKALLENGAYVVAAYRSEQKQKELVELLGNGGNSLVGIHADVTSEAQIQGLLLKTVEKYGRVDILLNIVGTYKGGTDVSSTPESDWDFLMDINLKSAFLCSKAVLPYMVKQNYGKIVNVSAKPAVEKRFRVNSGAYAVSKIGVKVLTETIAEEVKQYDINVNCIIPSTIDTPANRLSLLRGDPSKWVKPEHIAKVVLFLVSDDSKVISGASIPVYGKA